MDETKINFEATKQLGDSVQKEAGIYQEIYAQQIYTSFKNALQNSFQGDDATIAIEQLDSLRKDFDAMRDVIAQYGKQLVRAADGYEQDMLMLKGDAGNLPSSRK